MRKSLFGGRNKEWLLKRSKDICRLRPVFKAPKAGKPFRLYIDAQEHVIGRQQGVCGSLHQQKVGGCRNKE
jgi:hypothetical protein